MCCSSNTRHKADRDEKSDERVTICVFVPPRGLAQQRQQTQMLSLGDGWNGSVRYHCSHTVKTTGRGRSAPLAAACVCVYTGLQALSAVRASSLGSEHLFSFPVSVSASSCGRHDQIPFVLFFSDRSAAAVRDWGHMLPCSLEKGNPDSLFAVILTQTVAVLAQGPHSAGALLQQLHLHVAEWLGLSCCPHRLCWWRGL